MNTDIYQEYRPYKGRGQQAEKFYLDPHKRPRSQARILSDRDTDMVEEHILSRGGAPTAYLLKFRLSRYAGLRVGEILNIHLSDLVEPDGRVSDHVTVRPKVGKGGKGRKVPMHPRLAEAIRKFQLHHPDMTYVGFSQQHYTPKRQSLASLTTWFHLLYKQLGLVGCSSHSGRRTFITRLAKAAPRLGYSLRDVQMVAGHSRLESTETYIEPSANLGKLVRAIK